MTRDDVLKMPAGREMDALIAINIMGRKIQKSSDILFINAIKDESIPNYSTDIVDAWKVVDCLKSKCGEIAVGYTSDDKQWGCDIWYMHENQHGHSIGGFAETAPLAICRAALLAVMDIAQ